VAAAVLASAQGLVTARTVTCQTRGGEDLLVTLEGPPDAPEKIFLEGRVRYLFSGQVEADLFLK
jgi:diaminopimelate epimerase